MSKPQNIKKPKGTKAQRLMGLVSIAMLALAVTVGIYGRFQPSLLEQQKAYYAKLAAENPVLLYALVNDRQTHGFYLSDLVDAHMTHYLVNGKTLQECVEGLDLELNKTMYVCDTFITFLPEQ